MDGVKLGPTELRMQLLILFFNFPHFYWTIESGKIFVKIDKAEEKEQGIEKLLSSDLYPPIQSKMEGKSTFVGGVKKVQTINYSISIISLRRWCKQNDIVHRFSVLCCVCFTVHLFCYSISCNGRFSISCERREVKLLNSIDCAVKRMKLRHSSLVGAF